MKSSVDLESIRLSFAIGWGELAALTGASLFGIANVIYRSQREEIDATSITALKTWETVPCLALLVLVLGTYGEISDFSIEIIAILGVSVVLGLVLGDLIYIKGQELAGVSRAFPVAMSFPLITYLLEILILHESFQLVKGAAILIIVSGVALIGKSTERSEESHSLSFKTFISQEHGLGILFAVLAAFLWAAGAIALRVGVEDVDPVIASLIRTIIASLILIPMAGVAFQKRSWQKLPSKSLLLVLIAGFLGMTIGALLYVIAVKMTGASTASAISATAPMITVPLSAVFLKEKISPLIIVGTLLTVFGVILLVL